MKPSRTAAKGDHFGTSQVWSDRHAWRDGLLCEITSKYTGLIACMQTHMDSVTDDASFACTANLVHVNVRVHRIKLTQQHLRE